MILFHPWQEKGAGFTWKEKALDDVSINDSLYGMTWTVKTHRKTEKQIKRLPRMF
jgi:hypothetical protein